MASVEPTNTLDVVAGANPDSVAPSVRPWRLAPLRDRQGTTPPDYTDNGLDVFLHGDPEADSSAVSVVANIPDATRNGAKRSNSEAGSDTLWCEPAPLSYDTAGTSDGTLGVLNAPAGAADDTFSLGVAASHLISVAAAPAFPLVVRPRISVIGARFESAEATLEGIITTTLDGGTPTAVTRDLWYAYGGSTVVTAPTVTVAQSGSLEVEIDLQLRYRVAVAAAFEVAVAAAQVVFEVWEYTSVESSP